MPFDHGVLGKCEPEGWRKIERLMHFFFPSSYFDPGA